jgi:hypothetical protein
MLDELKKAAEKAKDAVTSTAIRLGDLNGDGKVDEEDAKIAAEWAKNKAVAVGDEATRLGKEALKSDMVKDAAAGAVVGAAVAIPVPVIGPVTGAAIGAGLGICKNFTKKESASQRMPQVSYDLSSELLKLEELREKGILTDEEFKTRKQKILAEN